MAGLVNGQYGRSCSERQQPCWTPNGGSFCVGEAAGTGLHIVDFHASLHSPCHVGKQPCSCNCDIKQDLHVCCKLRTLLGMTKAFFGGASAQLPKHNMQFVTTVVWLPCPLHDQHITLSYTFGCNWRVVGHRFKQLKGKPGCHSTVLVWESKCKPGFQACLLT